jgi:SnoaL-like domain
MNLAPLPSLGSLALAAAALGALATTGCTESRAHAAPTSGGDVTAAVQRLVDQEALRGLAYCYGRGLDEISRHHADRERGQRLATALYETCFDPAVVIEVYPLGATEPLRRTEGIADWVTFADAFFHDNGYSTTRHLMSNFAYEPLGPDAARLTSYASIPHFLIGPSARDASSAAPSVEYMLGRYEDEAARQPDGTWRTVRKTVYLEEIWRGVGFFPGGQGPGR